MTNYNDGKWHGHNCGECPVHPETVVEIVTATPGKNEGPAYSFIWGESDCYGKPIVAFRVIKEHKEPERTWSRCVDGSTYRNVELKFIDGIPHVREVTE